MRKKWLLVAGFILIGILMISPVLAFSIGDIDIRKGSEQLIYFIGEWAEPFLIHLLGDGNYGVSDLIAGNLLFEKFLFFLLILGVTFISLRKVSIFEDNKAILWVVSIIVPLLAVRFINFEWMNTVILSYTVLGVAIGGIIPFVIYFFFLEGVFKEHPGARKIGWLFFIIVYYGLWGTSNAAYGWIYFMTMVFAFIFLLFDGTIHRALQGQRWKHAERSNLRGVIASLDRDISDMRYSALPEEEKNREIRDLQRRRAKLRKQMY